MTTLTTTDLADLARCGQPQLACEEAYGSAVEHAFRAGEQLLAAKKELEPASGSRGLRGTSSAPTARRLAI